MKKSIFSALMVVCLLTAALSAQTQVIDYFDDDKYIVSSVTIQHPVLARVFPGIEFRKESSYAWSPPHERIIGLSGGYKKVMPYAFNTLYAQVADSSRASLDERLEAFVRLAYWTRDPNLEIVKQEEVKVEGRWFTFNHRVVFRLQSKGLGPQQHELLILFDRDQIIRVEIYVDGKKRSLIQPILIGATDQIDLQISGPNVLHTEEQHDPPNGPLYDHYYVVVSENGMATGNSITFNVSGLQPSSQDA